MLKKYLFLSLLLSICVVCSYGCMSTLTTSPHMGFNGMEWQPKMERSDYTVLDTVEGKSCLTSVLFGIVQVIDGDKWKILWIPFYEEKYALVINSFPYNLFVSMEDRAYYDALAKTPDADVVFVKSYTNTDAGVPLIWTSKTASVRGKAIKLKTDK